MATKPAVVVEMIRIAEEEAQKRLAAIPAKIATATAKMGKLNAQSLKHAVAMGKLLKEAKADCHTVGIKWEQWTADNLDFSKKHADNYIRIYDHQDILDAYTEANPTGGQADFLKSIRKPKNKDDGNKDDPAKDANGQEASQGDGKPSHTPLGSHRTGKAAPEGIEEGDTSPKLAVVTGEGDSVEAAGLEHEGEEATVAFPALERRINALSFGNISVLMQTHKLQGDPADFLAAMVDAIGLIEKVMP